MKRSHIGVLLVAVTLVVIAGFVGLSGDSGEQLDEDTGFADDTDDAVPADDAEDAAPADDTVDEAASAEESAPEGDTAAEASMASERSETAPQQSAAADRQLVHTGSVELLVDDVPETSAEIRELTVDQGGFVSESSQEIHEAHNETWTTERLVVRVPSEGFDESMGSIEALGEVQAFETDTEDVTDQLVDIEARLENLRTERDRLRELFENANETRDVLAVQNELSSVQEEIERLAAQRQQLEERVAYSTITVFLTEERPEAEEPPEEPEWYETSVAGAFLESVDGLVTAGRALVIGLAFVGPYLLVFGLLTLVTGGLYRYRSRSGTKMNPGRTATDRGQQSDDSQAEATTEDESLKEHDQSGDEHEQSGDERDDQ